MFNRKPKVGYQNHKPKKKPKKKKNHYIASLIVAPTKKVSLVEKLIKFIIYIALRIVIKPSKWKEPEKNYEIIDRTYKRVMSADFIFIPSSIAFYLIMSFMPILSIIAMTYLIPGLKELLGTGVRPDGTYASDAISDVVGKFIPGAHDLFKQMKNAIASTQSGIDNAAITATILSLLASTWISAGGFSKLVFTQSYIYEHKFVGGYWMNKLKGMSMVLGFTLYLILALSVNISFNTFVQSSNLSHTSKNALIYLFLVFGLFIGTFIGFLLLFKFSPRYKIKLREVVPGTMVTTIPTVGFLSLFGIISSYWSYGSYGSVGVIMYIGMASLIITYFIFVGLTANAAYYKTFVSTVMRNKKTLSKK